MKAKKAQEKSRLGRGLAALLGADINENLSANTKAPTQSNYENTSQLAVLPIEVLEPSPFQPRQFIAPDALEELANSIRHHGILQPLLVRENPDKNGMYQIIAGERRWRAAQKAQLHEVPVRLCSLSDSDAMAAALVENLQRADLNIVEEAEGFQRLLKEFELTQEELAEAVGKSRPHVTNTVRLLQLPEEVRELLRKGLLSAGHARALLMHPHPMKAAKEIIDHNLTVRQTEALVKRDNETKAKPSVAKIPNDPEIQLLERDLRGQLGLKVQIQFDGKGGSVRLYYRSLEQFDEILKLLKTTKEN